MVFGLGLKAVIRLAVVEKVALCAITSFSLEQELLKVQCHTERELTQRALSIEPLIHCN